MSAHNFWHNFTHGFMHGMFGNNPFFGCWGSFRPMWGNPFMFGGFNSCFNPFGFNSSIFLTPCVMTTGFYPLMPEMSPPSLNFNINMNELFSTDNVWDNLAKQNANQGLFDTFIKTKTEKSSSPEEKKSTSSTNNEAKTTVSNSKKTSSANNTAAHTTQASNNSTTNLKNAKLTDKFTGSAEQLNKVLNRKNGVLKNKGQVFLDAQERYGINAAILAAICINESGYGTSPLARTKNNVGGVSQGMGFKSYKSVDECIMDMARFLKSGYVDKGLVTIEQVGKKYCPVGDPRDTKGVNAGWGNVVASITNKIETLA